MKKTTLLIYLLLTTVYLTSQSWISSSIIQSDGDITVIKSSQDIQNNTFLLGHYAGSEISGSGISATSYGGRDYFVSKFNAAGNLEWIKSIGGTLDEDVTGGIYVGTDNYIYVTGGFQNDLKYSPVDSISSTGTFDIFLMRFDQDGDVDWITAAGIGPNWQKATSLSVSDDGNILLAGYFRDSISFYSDTTLYAENTANQGFYAKFNSSDGSFIWAKGLKTLTGTIGGRINDIITNSDHYIFSGFFAGSVVFGNDTLYSNSNSVDALFVKTNPEGDIEFIRIINGSGNEISYKSVLDNENNIYFTGYYNSPELIIDSTETIKYQYSGNNGNFDLFISKYNSLGNLQWIKTAGGPGSEILADAAFFNNEINVSGLFSDTLNWGGIQLSSSSVTDRDMFIGSLSVNGNFRSANSFGGRNNSTEDARSIFSDGENLYTVIRSNSDLLVLGDDIYTNPSLKYFVAVGKIGCLPININSSRTNVTGCYGDETGTIFVGASGGFGGPFRYSIDDGDSYQNNDPNFADLAAGVYNTVVADKENCVQAGPVVTITQPDEIVITNVASDNVLCNGENGSIMVEGVGGTGSLFFSTDNGVSFPNSIGSTAALPAGNYDVVVKDGNNCEVAGPAIEITQPDALAITAADKTDLVCHDDASGTLNITVTGGVAPYEYSIDGGTTFQADALFENLDAGTYTIKITDENDCELTGDDVTLTQPGELIVTVDEKTDLLCNGDDDGTITLSATGGTAPYEFSIDSLLTKGSNSAFTDLPAGVYDVFVVDDAGCIGTAGKTEITQPDTLKLILISSSDITSAADGQVVLEASGGTEPYTFTQLPENISQATGTFTFGPGEAGVYSFELDDDNNCGPKVQLVQINDLTNISEVQLSEGVIYPNPSTGQITIEMTTEKDEMIMEVVTLNGKIMLQKRVFSSGGRINETIDLSNQPKGIYMIRMDDKTFPSGVILQ
jgi:hypothetical protein